MIPSCSTRAGSCTDIPLCTTRPASDFASAAPIVLEAGRTLNVELFPVLQPYYSVKIALPNMQAEGPVQVSVMSEGRMGPGYSLSYAREGTIQGLLPNGIYTVEAALQGQQGATGSVNITVKGAPVTNAKLELIPDGSIPVGIKEELSASTGSNSSPVLKQGKFSREQKADISLQPADDFNSMETGFLRPLRKPHDNEDS